jgi:hypothetical protein
MREITVTLILKPESGEHGEVEMFMQGQLGWSKEERSMFLMTIMGIGERILAGDIK